MFKIVGLVIIWSVICYVFGKHQGYNEGLQDADFETVDCGFWDKDGNYIEDLQKIDKREINDNKKI